MSVCLSEKTASARDTGRRGWICAPAGSPVVFPQGFSSRTGNKRSDGQTLVTGTHDPTHSSLDSHPNFKASPSLFVPLLFYPFASHSPATVIGNACASSAAIEWQSGILMKRPGNQEVGRSACERKRGMKKESRKRGFEVQRKTH